MSEEAGLNQQTMKICLDEIERSQRISPKPNFIVLLGNRYGWRPLPYEISADEFEEIKSVITDEDDRKFLFWEGEKLNNQQLKNREGWYCLDTNAVPSVYCLKPRIGDYDENDSDDVIKEAKEKETNDWYEQEKRLKSLLSNAIEKLGWDENDPRRFKYNASATEQEIIRGVLNPPDNVKNPENHVFGFFREIEESEKIYCNDKTKDFFDFNENETIDESSKYALKNLKKRLRELFPENENKIEDHVKEYWVKWTDKGVSKAHLEYLCRDVYISLSCIIMKQITAYEETDHLDLEIEAHKEFGKNRCQSFMGRKENLSKIKNYLETPNSKPMIIYGDSGSGKSALMAKAIEYSSPNFYEIQKNEYSSSDELIVRFIGATPESSDIRSLLESLSRQITKLYNKDDSNIPIEYNDLVQDFKNRLNFATTEKPLIIFLDALDQLSNSENAHNLTWLPDTLPKNVHIVLSTLKGPFQSYIDNRIPDENLDEVSKLSEGKELLESWLKNTGRTLTYGQEKEIISKFEIEGLPLYLKLAFEEAKLWKSYSPIPELKSDIRGIINFMLERLSRPENHGKILVSHSLGYLSTSKNGLTEDEILDVLALDDEVFKLTKKFHRPTEEKLPVAVWSRLYFDLEPYLTEREADNTKVLSFYNTEVQEVVNEKFLDNDKKFHRHQILSKYFNRLDLFSINGKKKTFNYRKLAELPYNLTHSHEWGFLFETLTNPEFLETKCSIHNGVFELLKDYKLALSFLESNFNEENINVLNELSIFFDKYSLMFDVNPKAIYSQISCDYSGLDEMLNIITKWQIYCHSNDINHINRLNKSKPFLEGIEEIKLPFTNRSFFVNHIPTFNQLLFASHEGDLALLDADSFNLISWKNLFSELPSKSGLVWSIVIHDLNIYICISGENKLYEFDINTLLFKRSINLNIEDPRWISVSNDGKIAIGGVDSIEIFEGKIKEHKIIRFPSRKKININYITNMLLFDSSGQYLAIACQSGDVLIYDCYQKEFFNTKGYCAGGALSLAFDSNSNLYAGGIDGKILFWDIYKNEFEYFETDGTGIEALLYIKDENLLFSGHRSGNVGIWNTERVKIIKFLNIIPGYVLSLHHLIDDKVYVLGRKVFKFNKNKKNLSKLSSTGRITSYSNCISKKHDLLILTSGDTVNGYDLYDGKNKFRIPIGLMATDKINYNKDGAYIPWKFDSPPWEIQKGPKPLIVVCSQEPAMLLIGCDDASIFIYGLPDLIGLGFIRDFSSVINSISINKKGNRISLMTELESEFYLIIFGLSANNLYLLHMEKLSFRPKNYAINAFINDTYLLIDTGKSGESKDNKHEMTGKTISDLIEDNIFTKISSFMEFEGGNTILELRNSEDLTRITKIETDSIFSSYFYCESTNSLYLGEGIEKVFNKATNEWIEVNYNKSSLNNKYKIFYIKIKHKDYDFNFESDLNVFSFGHKSPVIGLTVIENGEILISLSNDGNLKVWSTSSGNLLSELYLKNRPIAGPYYMKNNHFLCADSGQDGEEPEIYSFSLKNYRGN